MIISFYSPSIEIGRYQSNIEDIHDRFIGYQVDEKDCVWNSNKSECWHLKLVEEFKNASRLGAYQLGMFDSHAMEKKECSFIRPVM